MCIYVCLTVYVCIACMQKPVEVREGIRAPGTKLQAVVTYHVEAGKETRSSRGQSSQCSPAEPSLQPPVKGNVKTRQVYTLSSKQGNQRSLLENVIDGFVYIKARGTFFFNFRNQNDTPLKQ